MKIIISNASNQPIYEQIYSQIKKLIITNELLQGDMLPSIRMLAKDLRISVITTKRAYDELEHDGYINTVAGKGCFVSKANIELLREENLQKIEEHLLEISALAQLCGLKHEEIIEMLNLLRID